MGAEGIFKLSNVCFVSLFFFPLCLIPGFKFLLKPGSKLLDLVSLPLRVFFELTLLIKILPHMVCEANITNPPY